MGSTLLAALYGAGIQNLFAVHIFLHIVPPIRAEVACMALFLAKIT